MNKLQLLVSTGLSTLSFCLLQVPCQAAETIFKEVAQDSLYGGIAGAVIGSATITFTRRPGDDLEYMARNDAAGIPGAAKNGSFSPSALMEVKNGKVRFAIPTVIPDVKDSRKTNVVVIAEIIKGRF